MSKKTIKGNETITLKITAEEAQFIKQELERRNRPNVFKRMGTSIADGSRATGRFFSSTGTKISDSFKSVTDMSQKAESIITKIPNAKNKEEMFRCLDQLEAITGQMRTFVRTVEVHEEQPKVAVEDTAPVAPQPAN